MKFKIHDRRSTNTQNYNTAIRTSSDLQPFSLGHLVGDLVIRFDMAPEKAITVGRKFEEVLNIARETRGIKTVDSDAVRRGVESLLQGRSRAAVAAEIAERGAAPPTAAPHFRTPATGPEVLALEDAAAAYALHLLAEAERGEGDPVLVEAVGALMEEVKRSAEKGFEAAPEVRAAYATYAVKSSRQLIAANHNPKSEEELQINIGKVIRWIADFLHITDIPTLIGPDDDDDPRDTPKPTGFGEELPAAGWQLEENLLRWKALRKTGRGTDEMRIISSFEGFGQSGKSTPKKSDFQKAGEAQPGNHHTLGRVNLFPEWTGLYTAIHLLTEEDATDDETAEKAADIIVTILGKIASGVLSKGIDTAGGAASIPLPGAIIDILAGPAINKASDIVGGKLREILAKAFGPETFYPVPVQVVVTWQGNDPRWDVFVQGYYMGTRFGGGELRSLRYPNGMPYTVEQGGPGRYTYTLRFRVG